MKFGETFTEFLHGDQERFLVKCSHVEYKRLKKVLKICRSCRNQTDDGSNGEELGGRTRVDSKTSSFCRCESCPCMYQFDFHLPSSLLYMVKLKIFIYHSWNFFLDTEICN